jgi:drug/metabolite transporter (DMT)-like permease
MPELPWYVFALLGAFIVSLAVIFEKRALRHDEPLHFSASATILVGLLSVPFLFFVDWAALTPEILGFLYAISILSTIAFCLVTFSLKRLEAGEQSLILALTPAVTAVFALFLIGEALSVNGYLGILLVVLGLITLELPSLKTAAFHKKMGAVALTVLVVFMYAGSAVLDRVVLGGYGMNPIDMLVLTQVGQMINITIYGLFRGKHDRIFTSSFMRQPGKVTAFSVLMFLSRITYVEAVSVAAVALVAALKRTGALFTVVMARAYLNERGMGHKLVAGIIILLGVVAILL